MCAKTQPRGFAFRLEADSGVPVYRQLIDQVLGAIASGTLAGGQQLPTVRQAAVDLAINPNTVIRAYRELEIRGVLTTEQGTGTFISHQPAPRDNGERRRQLARMTTEMVARAGAAGFTLEELLEELHDRQNGARKDRR